MTNDFSIFRALRIGSKIIQGTEGSILFVDSNGKIAQDNANFFLDNILKRLGLGTNTPGGNVHIFQGSSGATADTSIIDLIIESDDTIGMSFLTPNNKVANIRFGDPENNQAGGITYTHSSDLLTFRAAGVTVPITFGSDGVGFGTHVPKEPAHVGFSSTDTSLNSRSDEVGLVVFNEGNTTNMYAGLGISQANSGNIFGGFMGIFTDPTGGAVVMDAAVYVSSNNVPKEHSRFKSDGKFGVGLNNPVTDIHSVGGFAANIVSKTGAYTTTSSDHTILCGAGNETFTITLVAASGVSGLIQNIKNIGTGTITVDGNASETIDGGATAIINTQYECITIQCDGSNWHII